VRLGEGIADENGSFEGTFPLSSSAQLGQHTVVVHGVSTKGEVITVAIGVKVVDNTRAPEQQSSSRGTFMGYVLLGLLLMTGLVLLVIRRRNQGE
jgi:LPXTG-motif cell wall-anchored protein